MWTHIIGCLFYKKMEELIMEAKTALVKYIFLDVVNYSYERTVEAQSEIINILNRIVKETIEPFKLNQENLIYLPTGDGICICIINTIDPYDIHLQIAITILQKLDLYNKQQDDEKRKFNIRIGINENQDNIITDINENTNVAGAGINYAQRIMGMAEGNQIFIGQSVYDKLVQREKYNNKFYRETQIIKHDIPYTAYQYINKELTFINSITKKEILKTVVKEEKIPKQIIVYLYFTKYFEKDIIRLSGRGSNTYTLNILLYYLTEDYMSFESMDNLERKKWKSKIFKDSINSFDKAFQLIENAFFWLICDSRTYYISHLELNKWTKLFKNDFLSYNKNFEKQIKKEWTGISKEIITYLPLMYPWLQDEEKYNS